MEKPWPTPNIASKILRDNIRAPFLVVGDMEAQIAASRIGADRLRDLLERFGADPDVVGRDLRLDGQAHRVVGVMAPITPWDLAAPGIGEKMSAMPRVFRRIPGLEQASFVRFGMIHRNTFVNAGCGVIVVATFLIRRFCGVFESALAKGVVVSKSHD